MIPSTNQSIVTSMSDLVLTSPDGLKTLECLFEEIEQGMVTAGKTEGERGKLWLEALVMLRCFLMAGEAVHHPTRGLFAVAANSQTWRS